MTQHAPRTPTDLDAAIGSRIRVRRLELKMSQTDVADALGVKFQQVQKYEDGSNRLAASRLPALAELLKVDIGYFFDPIEAPNGEDDVFSAQLTRPVVVRLIMAAQGCGDRVVAAACAMLEAIRKETGDV